MSVDSATPTSRLIAAAVLAMVLSLLAARRPLTATDSGHGRFAGLVSATAVPPQQEYSPGPDPAPPPPFIEMGDPRADDYIVRDINLGIEGDGWRWTHLVPTLQFHLKDRDRQRFAMDFSIIDTQFKVTGPVTLSCYINDRLLGELRCPKPGEYHFSQPVPAAWLTSDPVIVRAVLDKVWTAPGDGARLGYVLRRAGFGR